MQNVIQGKEQAIRQKMGAVGGATQTQLPPQEQPEDILALVTRKIVEQPPRYKRPKGAVEVPGGGFVGTRIYQKPDPKDPSKVIYSNIGSSEMLTEGQQAWTNVLLHIVDAMKKSKSADVTEQQKARVVLDITKLYYQTYRDIEEKDRPPIDMFIRQQMATMYPGLLNPEAAPSMNFPTSGEPQYATNPVGPQSALPVTVPQPGTYQRNVPVVGQEQTTMGLPQYKPITGASNYVRRPIGNQPAQGKVPIRTGRDKNTRQKVILYSDGTSQVVGQKAIPRKQARPPVKSPAKSVVAPETPTIDLSGAGVNVTGAVPVDETIKDIAKAIESLKVSDETKARVKKMIYESIKKGETISPSYQGM
ncbi:MAG: hypothetical protein KJ888_20215, partial [Gammaproteobacteria bacterium]|nr:hypothetical protein [Gammaproteobacteria bacterium]